MPTPWNIQLRLGSSEHAAIHDLTVEAAGPAEALRQAATILEREASNPELLIDGQEEVFSRSEVEVGAMEHQADT